MRHDSFDVIFSRLQISFSLDTERAAFAKIKTRDKLSIMNIIKFAATPTFTIRVIKRFMQLFI